MESIDPKQIVGYVKSLGFNVFYGSVEYPFNISVRWDKDKGDLKDFMRLAKVEGAKLIIIDWFDLDDEMIEARMLEPELIPREDERDITESRNETMESHRKNVGETAAITVSWVKDSVRYLYAEATDWWLDLSEIFDDVDEQIGGGPETHPGF